MTSKTIAFACDHAGPALKNVLMALAEEWGYKTLNLGTDGPESVDYPDFGVAMAKAIEDKEADLGVLICGTGIGISIAANRNPNVRAALCHSGLTARLTRQHNNANVLALGARIIGEEVAIDCLKEFLNTEFEGGRHERRVNKLS
ncbi:ribose 5-phosphate isomerase B [Temperatibacter marinus]|uniref:Ribose 5-phosphate isomerase B n=1 Tax=Temperatibacter marinus TaxID=1456591 RepID=A0AA52H978_9PROT|nr:ribose 5-phosphate isomerase B [Temperatibacter marinus]WND02227.1 ribose 5-phosphate isomerase B [Temperatibacter marinus]